MENFRTTIIKTLLGESYPDRGESNPASDDMESIKKKHKFYKHGISPEMGKDIEHHVKKHGDGQIWNHFGTAGGNDPDWWDGKKKKVKKLKQSWVVDN